MLLLLLLIQHLFIISNAEVPPNCAQGLKCPTGGLWSEWATSQNCSTDCGTCSRQLFTRKCLSGTIEGCECIGDSSRYVLCNTQTCQYPAQRTCCIPFVPMLINGSMQCGPLPKFTDQYQPCCPIGGLWSSYSSFGRNDANTLWIRTRKCLSQDAGCPCTGVNRIETADCPCKFNTIRLVNVGGWGIYPQNVSLDHSTCEYVATLVHVNPGGPNRPCTEAGSDPSESYDGYYNFPLTPLIRYNTPTDSSRRHFRPYNCEDAGKRSLEFFCDLETEWWRLMHNGEEVNGWNQINQINV